jgi:hypothetical protein
MNINIAWPTSHQWAVFGSHAVVGASGIVAGVAFFGGLDPTQVQTASEDISRIAADVKDLVAATISLGGIAMTAYSVIKSGPFASFFRAARDIASDPKMLDQVKAATLDQQAPVVTITEKMPDVAIVGTNDTKAGQALATAVPSNNVQVIAKT